MDDQFAFGRRVIRASGWGWGTVIIHLEKGMMMVAFEIIIDVVFGINFFISRAHGKHARTCIFFLLYLLRI